MFSDDAGFFSIDAFFAVLLLLTVASAMLNEAQQSKQSAQEISHLMEQDMAAEKLATGINTVYSKGRPLTLNFELPGESIEENYTLSLENRMIIVENSSKGLVGPIGKASIVPANVSDFTLNLAPENEDFSNDVIVFWEDNTIEVEKC